MNIKMVLAVVGVAALLAWFGVDVANVINQFLAGFGVGK